MLSTIPFKHTSVDSSPTSLKPSKIAIDSETCLSQIISLDTVDNPLLKHLLEPDVAEEHIIQRMKSECNRLYSYQNKWPLRHISPENLADAGFFYLQDEDKVQCPFCRIIISNWTFGDKPLREHMKKNPKCPFLMGQEVGNIPLSSRKLKHNFVEPIVDNKSSSVTVSYKPKHPRMADVKRRLLTYSGWPLSEPGIQKLAECGLYYSGVADVVTCFFCGGTLGNWDPTDDPWLEHAKFFPECSFLALNKTKRTLTHKAAESQDTSIPKQSGPSSGAIADIVEQALDIFPEDLVLEAVRNKKGSPFTLQEICDDVLLLKQKTKLQLPQIPLEIEAKTNSGSTSNNDLLLCKVCMDRERCVVFQPCGHFISCWNCSSLLADCPVCRRRITYKIRTYIS